MGGTINLRAYSSGLMSPGSGTTEIVGGFSTSVSAAACQPRTFANSMMWAGDVLLVSPTAVHCCASEGLAVM